MRVFIITMDDPVQTLPFIKKVIEERKDWIVGVAIAKGDRLTIRKKQSKGVYLLSLLMIMGPLHFIKNSFVTLRYKGFHLFGRWLPALKKKTFEGWLEKKHIPVRKVSNVNDPEFLDFLYSQDIDVIINQSQSLLKQPLLDIPKIGVINRHNALLPKNRGRLTPFWVLHKGESETGVSIHFVTKKLDAGKIIVQKRFNVAPDDTFNSLVKKNYTLAPKAMTEALDKLEAGESDFMENDDAKATYNTTPGLKEAFSYRKKLIQRKLTGKNSSLQSSK